MKYELFSIALYICLAIAIAAVIIAATFLLSDQLEDSEKVTPYECGFDAFEEARHNFNVKYYIVAILFILFDLEITFLFPWVLTLAHVTTFGFWTMFLFLMILTVGFVYEWQKGALEWE